jgi:hypothetical protein
MELLVIGRNNVFFQRAIGDRFYSHDQIQDALGLNCTKVVVTAFDPQKKTVLELSKPKYLSDQIIDSLQEKQIYYISTARANDDAIVHDWKANHHAYVNSKIFEEEIFFELFDNVTVCRVPNLLGEDDRYTSRFQRRLSQGIAKGHVRFDTTRNSSWNFLFSRSILSWIQADNGLYANERVTLLADKNLTAKTIGDYMCQDRNCIVSYGRAEVEFKAMASSLVKIKENMSLILRKLAGTF